MALPDSVELPLLPLRDVVVYPNMVLPLLLEEKSIAALEHAMASDKQIILAAQRCPQKTILALRKFII